MSGAWKMRATLAAWWLLALVGGCRDQGSFSVEFTWADEPPASAGLYAVGRVEYAPAKKSPQTLASAGPEPLTRPLRLDFSDVPVGSDRRVVVEIREDPGSAARVRYYGVSKLFELRAGEDTKVPVELALVGAPGVARDDQALALDGDRPNDPVATADITLLATTDSAVALQLSNAAGFPAGASTETLQLDEAEPREPHGYAVRWNLERGRAEAERCEQGETCVRTVFGRFVDDRGYPSRVHELRVSFDRAEPFVLEETVDLQPLQQADNALVLLGRSDAITANGRNTTLQLGFATNEPVSSLRVYGLRSDGVELPFTQSGGNDVTFAFAARYELDRSLARSVFSLVIEATDLAGNVGQSTLSSNHDFEIDTEPPSVTDAAAAREGLVYVRRPHGPDPSGNARPYFALRAAPHVLEPDTLLAVFDGPDPKTAQRLELLELDANDGSTDAELARRDVPEVYVMAVDRAGNASATARVRNVEWLASFNASADGTSPHRFDERPHFLPTLENVGRELAADGGGKLTSRVHGAGRWESIGATAAPDSRKLHRVAFDRARGKLVLFGGRKVNGPDCDDSGSDLCQGPWEWDGRRWQQRTELNDLPLPAPREEHGMTWDGRRGQTVIFGGRGPSNCKTDDNAEATTSAASTYCGDTWGYDGERFVLLASAGADQPARRAFPTLSYDEKRARVVLFGGASEAITGECAGGMNNVFCRDTWEWDGEHWSHIEVSESPAPRVGHASVYDPISGRVLVFAGKAPDGLHNDTWAWDGARWQELDAAPLMGEPPTPRQYAALAFNQRLGRVVMYGGESAGNCDGGGRNECGMLWSFDGARWQRVSLASETAAVLPPAQAGAALGEDAFGDVVLVGGESNDGTYTFRDGRYRERSGALHPAQPAARYTAVLASDPKSGLSLLYSGIVSASGERCPGTGQVCSDAWLWDGSGWTSIDSAQFPPGCEQASFNYDAVAGDALLFGGRTREPSYCNTGYRFDFSARTWSAGSPMFAPGDAAVPVPRLGHAVASTSGGAFVVMGGEDVPNPLADTWRFAAGAWTQWPSLPQPRVYAAAVGGDASEPVLLFGGEFISGPCPGGSRLADRCLSGDTYLGSASGWTLVAADAAAPSPRTQHSLIQVPARGAPVLFGGQAASDCGSGLVECNDLWEWRGDRWLRAQPADPEKDGDPRVRIDHAMTYDAARQVGLLFGGSTGRAAVARTAFDDTWLWHPGHDAMPGQVARFSFGSTLAPANAAITALELRWSADARAEGADGAQLWAFYRGRFQKVEDIGLAPTGDGVWRTTDAAILNGLLFGEERVFGFAQTPRGINGRLPEYAWVETHAVELSVQYSLPEERKE